ncbi:MAG: 50S ribosomal protein L18 [Thermoguttaceae bacterium]|nr:50S ribosomal protein L18 [Thermoguttaceae bacterium]
MQHEKVNRLQRQRRRWRVRNKIKRHTTRSRLCVFRSLKHMYAQVIDDNAGRVLASASTLDKEVREQVKYGGNVTAAQAVGRAIAQRALAAGVKQVAFDRREYKYHGRIAALADAARDAGLDVGAKKEIVAEEKPAKPEPKKGKEKGEKAEKPKKEKKAKGEESPAS